MRILTLLLLTFFFSSISIAQTYIQIAPSISNNPGTFSEKSNISLELGRQWDVFSLGLDIGKTNLGAVKGHDTTNYLELRPNLNVFQQDKFTNTLTIGIGYIFNAEESLLTESTLGIEYAYSQQIHFNMYFGQYFTSGRYSASSETFFGVSAMFYFKPTHTKSLLMLGEKKDK